MRYAAALLLAATAAAPFAAPSAAQAQTRVIAQANGWSAFGGTTPGGAATCGLETRDPNTGRHFLLQHVVGQDQPVLRLSRPSWNLGASPSRPVRIVIDNRRIFSANASGAGREMSWPQPMESFEQAFRQGALMRVEFPSGQDTPWNLSLTGTNTVMGAFVGCMRMMVIQPGEAPPPTQGPIQEPIRPPPPAEPPPLGPPLEAPTPPPAQAPMEAPRPVEPAPAPPAQAPRHGMPTDKPVPAAPDGKPTPAAKPGPPTAL